jgi:hypothetical protein
MKKALIALVISISTYGYAQDLVVTLQDNSTETFAIAGIRSIKFGASSMILNQLDGTVTTWNIEDIDNYAFDEITSLQAHAASIISTIQIYPNPASTLVNFNFSIKESSYITAEITDVQGRHAEQLFQGYAQGEQHYQWQSNVQQGVYYLRIRTPQKLITKPIIIQ